MEHLRPEQESAQPLPHGIGSDPWIAWLNTAPALVEPQAASRRLDGTALVLLLCGVAFWGALAWAGYTFLI